MTIFHSVGFWRIQKTARKSVTDFGSVFTKRREGCFFCAAIFRVCHPAHEMALPSFWAKSLFPLLQRHCHWRKWRIKEEVFFEESDGGIHILHNRHIASIEPVCTSTDVPSRFFFGGAKDPLAMVATQVFQLVVSTQSRIHWSTICNHYAGTSTFCLWRNVRKSIAFQQTFATFWVVVVSHFFAPCCCQGYTSTSARGLVHSRVCERIQKLESILSYHLHLSTCELKWHLLPRGLQVSAPASWTIHWNPRWLKDV